jgi:hypothetical protein
MMASTRKMSSKTDLAAAAQALKHRPSIDASQKSLHDDVDGSIEIDDSGGLAHFSLNMAKAVDRRVAISLAIRACQEPGKVMPPLLLCGRNCKMTGSRCSHPHLPFSQQPHTTQQRTGTGQLSRESHLTWTRLKNLLWRDNGWARSPVAKSNSTMRLQPFIWSSVTDWTLAILLIEPRPK